MDFSKKNYFKLNDYSFRKRRRTFSLIKKLFIFCIITLILYLPILHILYNRPDSTSEPEPETKIDILGLEDFEFLIPNEKKGPITVDRENDDGSKLNIYSMIIENLNDTLYNDTLIDDNDTLYNDTLIDDNNDTLYDDDNELFNKLEEIINIEPQYLCEYSDRKPPESFKGYSISCPTHYTISINNTFYGRYKDDFEHCTQYPYNMIMNEQAFNETCGVEPLDTLKELCEDRKECLIRPCDAFFRNVCQETYKSYKYLYIDYYCKKDTEIKKPRIMINMFSNKIEVNSVYENAISEFYQYSKYYGYKFVLNRYRYDNEREIFYMKLNTLIENLIKCLKEKSYDWIFWADSDTIIANPNIKLETFLPNEKMDLIHFIAADDINGLNCGVFFIRVHPWSLNLLMRAYSYFYYHSDRYLLFADQSSINNVLTGSSDADGHYIIVPKYWFNSYIDDKEKGEFLVHLAGQSDKSLKAKQFRLEIKNDTEWYTSMNSNTLRKKVLEYYDLPEENQHYIRFQ